MHCMQENGPVTKFLWGRLEKRGCTAFQKKITTRFLPPSPPKMRPPKNFFHAKIKGQQGLLRHGPLDR